MKRALVTEASRALDFLIWKLNRYEDALVRIDALDRGGHNSEVAADMGYVARTALRVSNGQAKDQGGSRDSEAPKK